MRRAPPRETDPKCAPPRSRQSGECRILALELAPELANPARSPSRTRTPNPFQWPTHQPWASPIYHSNPSLGVVRHCSRSIPHPICPTLPPGCPQSFVGGIAPPDPIECSRPRVSRPYRMRGEHHLRLLDARPHRIRYNVLEYRPLNLCL